VGCSWSSCSHSRSFMRSRRRPPHAQDPVYLTVLVPVLALLLGRIAGGFGRAWILVAVAGALSLVGLFRLNDWARPVPQGPLAPRNIDNLISTLDRLHVDRVYADHWLAYVLVYDTNERIIAAENLLQRVRFVDGRAIAAHKPTIRWPAYEREVNAAPARGFVFFRETLAKTPIVPRSSNTGTAATPWACSWCWRRPVRRAASPPDQSLSPVAPTSGGHGGAVRVGDECAVDGVREASFENAESFEA